MYGPEGNSFAVLEGSIKTRGKTKLTSFQRDQTLSALLYRNKNITYLLSDCGNL